MIRWIVKREFINNVQSFRFFTLFALAVTLFSVNAFISSKEYHRELVSHSKSFAEHSTYGSGGASVDKNPNPLAFTIDGQSRSQDRTLDIRRTGDIAPGGVLYRENYLLQEFEVMDWAFIIKLLFSIFAILFTFDAICGEKEKGTLALVCSNSVPRGNIIVGKYLGAILTLIVPLFTGIVINILIVIFLGKINLSIQTGIRICLIVFAGLIYLSVLVLLGLSISSATHKAPTSLLLSLAVWLMLVVVIPTLAGIAGDQLSKVPTESEFAERQDSIYQIHRDAGHGQKLLQDMVRNRNLTVVEEIQEEAEKLLIKAADDKIKLNRDMWRAVESKENLARNLARISPSVAFQFAGESLALTGVAAERSFYGAAQSFVAVYRGYIQDKTGVAYRFDTLSQPWEIRAGGETLSISTPRQPGFPKEVDDLPQFSQPYPSISDSLRNSSVDLILLIVWNLLLFLSGNLLFIRYDVR